MHFDQQDKDAEPLGQACNLHLSQHLGEDGKRYSSGKIFGSVIYRFHDLANTQPRFQFLERPADYARKNTTALVQN